MNKPKNPTINYFDSKSRSQVLSNQPILSSNLSGWNSFNFAYFNYDTYELPSHQISSHSLGISLSSCQKEMCIDGKYQNCRKNFGFMTVLPARTDFWAAWTGKFDFIVLSIQPEKLAHFAPETIDPEQVELIPLLNTPEPDHLITGIALAVKQYLAQDPQANDFYIEHLENALYSYVLKKYCSKEYRLKSYNGLPSYKLKVAVDYINSNLGKQIKIGNLANLLDISQGYFNRLFRESMGTSPYQYILRQRIKKAQELLRKTNISLTDVADECGFSNQSKMTQYFRTCLGVTPRQYRNSQ